MNGHRDRPDDSEYPTTQLEPVRDVEPEPEPVPPPGRRQRGRRRAGADRPPTQQPVPSRAGRNLPAAVAVGVGLGALIVVPLFFYRTAFLVVVAAAVAIGMWEMARAVRRSGAHPPLVPLIAGGVLTIGLAWFSGPDALSLGLLVTVLGTMVWRLGDGPGGFQRDLTAATLIAVYVPFLGGFAALLAAVPEDGDLRVLVTLAAVVLSDTGGYAAGVSFGKHPMAPSISPKKSWEGFAGSVTAAALGSALLLWLLLDVAPWWGALFGLAISGAAVLGDLAESMIKRDLGVKDMSNLLPGHGGLMDRLDSILFALPTAYLLLAVFVPVLE
ncbi:phosphatidate cytidylyltransferase [Micromonospora sp. AMSO12t]|nr:phosphatidate cytidylyltransferase [Micromonospora sp. AMSO12t]